jgi:hypothetical protein
MAERYPGEHISFMERVRTIGERALFDLGYAASCMAPTPTPPEMYDEFLRRQTLDAERGGIADLERLANGEQ